MGATLLFTGAPSPVNFTIRMKTQKIDLGRSPSSFSCASQTECSLIRNPMFPSLSPRYRHVGCSFSTSSSSSSSPKASTKLYVSGLSFRTTEESLRNAFEKFGQLVEVNLVMDKLANRPRGFAFLHYETEEESQKAIEGMHGKVDLVNA
ncbi:Splicing factor-like protein [Parasponia andersonii]|uniref:Splicing factor-like protein n=1 Tax=Parasponia andersonii TaxID=3476 RepID=A0A2P5BCV5_PARAD|nr:Splicing factor-like protein [Parasponia andersonii]